MLLHITTEKQINQNNKPPPQTKLTLTGIYLLGATVLFWKKVFPKSPPAGDTNPGFLNLAASAPGAAEYGLPPIFNPGVENIKHTHCITA